MEFRLRAMERADAEACAAIVCASEIGERYGLTEATMAGTLSAALDSGGELFVAEGRGRVLGFAWMDPRGAFSSAPYLRLIAVDEALRGSGIGDALLAEFEARGYAVGRDWCLLVSDFNEGAQAFYERHGYFKVGLLPDFAKPGISELLMVKKRRGIEP